MVNRVSLQWSTKFSIVGVVGSLAIFWGTAVKAEAVMPDRPDWAWTFDDGPGATTVAPIFGGVVGAIVGAVDADSVHFTYDGNRSLNFDGTDDRVDVPGINISGGGNNAVSISAWIYSRTTSSTSDRAHIFGNWFQGNQSLQSVVLYGNGDLIRLMVNTPTGTQTSLTATLPKNEWVHVACVWDGNVTDDGFWGIYINGELANSAYSAGVLNDVLDEGTYGIGMDSGSTDKNRFFDGMIDELAVWRSALTADNAAWLYNHSIKELSPAVPEPSSLLLGCLAGLSPVAWRLLGKSGRRIAG
jgi:hypothetical protein